MKKQTTIWILTFIIIGCSIYLSLVNWENIKNLKLNELSDFYGGFVSTLVFIWLIYGYRMQADELSLQREELKHQVENTKKLVEQSEFQTQSEMESILIEKSKIKEEYTYRIRPVLVFYCTGKDDEGRSRWILRNVGHSTAINILVSCGAGLDNWIENDTALFSALVQNETKVLNWTSRHVALVTIYSDIEDNEYTTVCFENKNKITKGNIYPDLKPAIFEYQLNQS